MKKNLFMLIVPLLFLACGQPDGGNPKVKIVTNYGKIVVRLYDETPLHRDNFLKLVDDKSYDSVLFHRVIEGFMIQSGDPDSKRAQPGETLGNGTIGDDIDAEIVPGLFHKKGALAAAREGDEKNPERKSNGSQFYIVQGTVYTSEELEARVREINKKRDSEQGIRKILSQRLNRGIGLDSLTMHAPDNDDVIKERVYAICDSVFATNRLVLTPEQIDAYTTVGGSPHLDERYTVFGEVVKGLDVVDRIAAVQTDANDRPLKDVRIIRMVRVR